MATGIKIMPETAATARALLGRRAELEAAGRRDRGEQDDITHSISGHAAGINDALALLWQGVLEGQPRP